MKENKVNSNYDTQSNMYQLTINEPIEKGYTHEEIESILVKNFKTLNYFCMADEQASTFHTHIFVIFNSRVRFSMLKKYFPSAHIEKCKGRVSDNVNYIKKSGKWKNDKSKQSTKIDGTFYEFGLQPPDSKGLRNDMSQLYNMISSGMTNAEILARNQDYIMQVEKIDKVRTILLTEKFKEDVRLDLEVVYVYGKTGSGKTRGVFEEHGYSNVYRVTDYKHPFDNYNCQPVIMFDEFRSNLKITDMLLFCDIYPIELPSRYTNKFACYNKIYIVSNLPLEKQYSDLQGKDKESWEAFKRRIKKVVYHEDINKIKKYGSVKEYIEEIERGNE